MQKAMKTILVILLVLFFSSPAHAEVQPFSDSIVQSIVKQIQQLQDKITALRLKSIQTASVIPFTRNLKLGVSGNDVKSLQEFLANIPGVYPEKITSGYFGRLTTEAVKRFQAKYQIQATGFFGPLTRAKLNEFWTRGTQMSNVAPPIISTPSLATSTSVSVVEKMATVSIKEESLKSAATTVNVPIKFQLQPKPDYNLNFLAQRTQEIINSKREETSLATLLWDDALARVALEHNQDQAKDNVEITNPDLICHYPQIRHEGFISGFTLKERLENSNINYRSAGENIAILPVGKKFIYEYPADVSPPACPEIADFKSGVDPKDEATRKYNDILARAQEAVKNLESINWVNKEWATSEEIAQRTVEGWLNSPGHRKNIMNPAFNFGGMGVTAVNDYLIFTHNFVGR